MSRLTRGVLAGGKSIAAVGNGGFEEDGELNADEDAPGEGYERAGSCKDCHWADANNKWYAGAFEL